jgi:hypothetical protein
MNFYLIGKHIDLQFDKAFDKNESKDCAAVWRQNNEVFYFRRGRVHWTRRYLIVPTSSCKNICLLWVLTLIWFPSNFWNFLRHKFYNRRIVVHFEFTWRVHPGESERFHKAFANVQSRGIFETRTTVALILSLLIKMKQ